MEEPEVQNFARPALICEQENEEQNDDVSQEEDEGEVETIVPIRSVKELLQLREERLNSPPVSTPDARFQGEVFDDAPSDVVLGPMVDPLADPVVVQIGASDVEGGNEDWDEDREKDRDKGGGG